MPGSEVTPGAPSRIESDTGEIGRPTSVGAGLRRAWQRPLWFHAAVFASLLAVAAPFLNLSAAFTIDEGAYAIQVRDLDRGGWEFGYRGEAVDPEGRWIPLYNPVRGARDWFAYVKQPAYPVLLLAGTRLAGEVVGLHLFAILGALGVAVAAWLVAGEVDREAQRAAFWLAASGPVAVNAYVVWAHAPSAALAGFAMLAALRLARRTHPVWFGVLPLCVVGGVLLRAEGLLFAGALGVGLLLMGHRGRSWMFGIGLAALCAAAALGALALETRWRSAIVGVAYRTQGLRGDDASPIAAGGDGSPWMRWAGGRFEGAWNSLLRGSFAESFGVAVVTAALVLVAYAAFVARRRRQGWQRDVVLTLGAVTALYVLRLATGITEPITGLFAAWPVVLLGIALLPWEVLRRASPIAVVAATFAISVLATQYRIGGGREWGGRFFFPVLVPAAVLACLGLRHVLVSCERPRIPVTALVVALALLPSVTGISMLRVSRGQAGSLIDEVTSGSPSLVLTHAVGPPPFAWKTYPKVGWMRVPSRQFQEATARLRAAGVNQVTVMGPDKLSPSDLTSYPVVQDVTGPEARKREWRTLRLSDRP